LGLVKWRCERVDKTMATKLVKGFLRVGANDELVRSTYKTNKI